MRVRAIAALLCLLLVAAAPPALAEEPLGTPREEMDSFFSAFTFVPENPLPGDLPWLLRQIAREAPQDEPRAELPPLYRAAEKFGALISGPGVHYEEAAEFMGFDMRTEYWMKGGSIRKMDHTMGEVLLADGEWVYKYTEGSGEGLRLPADGPDAAFLLAQIKNTMLSAMAAAPYQQLEDEKMEGYDCEVFYMDIEVMGMKGNWLYVDNQTGALVKNQYGEGKNSMATTLVRLETGVGDDAFLPPGGVKFEGP